MIEIEVLIAVNRKSDIAIVEEQIVASRLGVPVYIQEFESDYLISFTSDYAHWELDRYILDCFPEYDFVKSLGKGDQEILIQISRDQSKFSTDGWGRPIEDPLNETKYLVKKVPEKPEERFNPKVKVLFDDQAKYYFVNITRGIESQTNKKGYLLLENFKTEEQSNSALFFKDTLYETPLDAFQAGCRRMSEVVENDFKIYLDEKKKVARQTEKIPRKIVRDFIRACNSFDQAAVLKDLDKELVYERRLNWRKEFSINGLDAFTQFLQSPEQQLCNRNFTIRSSWTFDLPRVIIGVKYLFASDDPAKQSFQKYGQLSFLLLNDKIVQIIDES